MTAMKKFISIIICMATLLGMMPVLSFYAADDMLKLDEYKHFSSYEEHDVAYYEFIPTVSDYYRFYTMGYTDTRVEITDHTDYNLIGSDDDGGFKTNCNVAVYLEKGQLYRFIVSYEGYYADFYSCITRTSTTKTTGIAQNNTYTVEIDDNNTSKFFKYIPLTSGYYVFDSEGNNDSYGILYDSSWNLLAKSDDIANPNGFYLQYYLVAGETYYLEATQFDLFAQDSYTLTISATDVINHIEIIQEPYDTSIIYDYVNNYLYEDSANLEGLKVKLVYSDGTMTYWEYGDDDIENQNLKADFRFDEWGNLYYEIQTPFACDSFVMYRHENPIKEIKVKSAPEIVCFENTNGHYEVGFNYAIGAEIEYFHYDVPDLQNVELMVKFKDGTTLTVNPYEKIDSRLCGISTIQDAEQQWKIGRKNYVYIEYFGLWVEIPVKIVKNPIKSVILNSAPTDTYEFGNENYGVFLDDGKYMLTPHKLNGIMLTAIFTDGTTKTYDVSDFEFKSSGDCVVDGMPVRIDDVKVHGAGEYKVNLNFCGYDIAYDVTVVGAVKGDIDGDGDVSVMDATAIQLYIARLTDLTAQQLKCADTDGDSDVSVMDATRIQLYIAKIIEKL